LIPQSLTYFKSQLIEVFSGDLCKKQGNSAKFRCYIYF